MALRILCPTDLSSSSDRALAYAVGLARTRPGTRITLLHVDDLPSYGLPEGTVREEPLRAAWRSRLDALAARFADVPIEPEIARGAPAEEILARAASADLVVMSTRGRHALARAVLGAVAHKVVRGSPVPVLALDPEAPARPVRKVLCMLDLSPASEEALEEAVRWAERAGAELHVLHAFQLPVYTLLEGGHFFEPDLPSRVQALRAEALRAVLARRAPGVDAKLHVLEGAPIEALSQLVADEAIDLVVVGTHGRSGVQRLVLGSVAEQLLRTARVPLLVVRG
ncbi:MAG: universal stress protein [Sandaracinaceae bacterium]|nr:universal stress protein [Sandaracinaceae bacterium]